MKDGIDKILIVSSTPENNLAFDKPLQRFFHEYTILVSDYGNKAYQLAIEKQPKIIIIDSNYSSTDCILTIKLIKSHPSVKDIPIVVISDEVHLNDYFEAGVDDFLLKPYTSLDFYYRIKCALHLSDTISKVKIQNDILTQQSAELAQQYQLLENQRKDIIDDITYSRRIQNAIMPNREQLSQYFHDYFLFFRPKRIVSGDFYWVAAKNEKIIVAVADCTGHGISGAFLTIAGTAFLNEIISITRVDAAEILNQLRLRIMRLLHQKGMEGEAADGMDISLAVIDFSQLKLQYAGANNPAYLVSNGVLTILPADRMPIGIHEHFNKPFTNQYASLNKGDMLYLFTDGFIDQFGGPNDQKFRSKRFQQLCLAVHNKPTTEQLYLFEKTIDEWMGYRDQVDDIAIIGIRI